MEKTYTVQDRTGKWSPPVTEDELCEYAKNGMMVAHTLISPLPNGDLFVASSHPRLASIFQQRSVYANPHTVPHTPPQPSDIRCQNCGLMYKPGTDTCFRCGRSRRVVSASEINPAPRPPFIYRKEDNWMYIGWGAGVIILLLFAMVPFAIISANSESNESTPVENTTPPSRPSFLASADDALAAGKRCQTMHDVLQTMGVPSATTPTNEYGEMWMEYDCDTPRGVSFKIGEDGLVKDCGIYFSRDKSDAEWESEQAAIERARESSTRGN